MDEEKAKIKSFTDLRVWQEAHKIVLFVYKLTAEFSRDEIFGLTSQMRRAAVSITSNIAESFSRQSYKEKARFYYISLVSLTELQNQIIISKDLNYIDVNKYCLTIEQITKIHKLINFSVPTRRDGV